jgi:hypothetical protein
MKAPGRLQRLGIGLILIGAYGAVGLNIYWRGNTAYETPLWYPEPIPAANRSKREYPFRRPYIRKEFANGPRRAEDTNQIWVQRPKMRFPKSTVGLNAVDSWELARWGVSLGALRHFLKERQRWCGFSAVEQLPSSARTWPVVWELDSLPPRRVLNRLPEPVLAGHPLVGWERARALGKYRRSVRPVRSWAELRAVPGWSAVDVHQLRCYFVLNRKDSLSLHP